MLFRYVPVRNYDAEYQQVQLLHSRFYGWLPDVHRRLCHDWPSLGAPESVILMLPKLRNDGHVKYVLLDFFIHRISFLL